MPIANCVIIKECMNRSGNLIDLWSQEAGVASEHMTINVIVSDEQLGNKYKIMANLALPTLWSTSDISSIQVGLAKALSKYFIVEINEVHVITNIVASGTVVESGKEIQW